MRLLRPADVAAMLNVSRSKIYVMVRRGRIEVVHVEGDIRIPESAVTAYLDANRVPARMQAAAPALPVVRRSFDVAAARRKFFGR